jgi:hypothetical protein
VGAFLLSGTIAIIYLRYKNYISMKLQERDWLMGEHKIGTQLFYSDVEPELVPMEPGTRVLPAAYFYEKGTRCELLKRHEPGEYRFMPNGGFEVWVEDGGRRYFELDQVIVHPAVIKHQKTLDKMLRKAEKEQAKRDRQYTRAARAATAGTGKRGRRPMDPAVKAQREADKATRAEKSGGKRGRPKSAVSTPKTPKAPTGGKRGRRPLDQATRDARASEAAARAKRSGGKRGRPKRG